MKRLSWLEPEMIMGDRLRVTTSGMEDSTLRKGHPVFLARLVKLDDRSPSSGSESVQP